MILINLLYSIYLVYIFRFCLEYMYRCATFYAHMQMGYSFRDRGRQKKLNFLRDMSPIRERGGRDNFFFNWRALNKIVYLFSVVSLVQVLMKCKKDKKKYIFFFPCSLKGLGGGGCPLKNRVFFYCRPPLLYLCLLVLGQAPGSRELFKQKQLIINKNS